MKFFKKTSVAVLVTVLVVALCCVWGYTRVYEETSSVTTHYQPDRNSGQSNLNYYLGWISDDARLFSSDTIDTLARENLTLDNTYGSLVAVKTVSYLNGRDIQSYAEETAMNIHLDRRDMLLLLDTNSESWYVTYGADLVTYVEADAELPNLFREHLNTEFWGEEGNPDEAILALFDDLDDWYEDNIPPIEKDALGFLPIGGKVQTVSLGSILSGILFTLLANLWWIALALIALNIVDRVRFEQYYTKKTSDSDANPRFHPFLFWHRPGSRWYEDMMDQAMEEDEEDDEEEEDFDPPGGSASQQGGENYQSGPGYSTDPNEPGPFGPQSGPDQQTWQAPPPPGPDRRSLASQVMDLLRTLAGLFWSAVRTIQNTLFRR